MESRPATPEEREANLRAKYTFRELLGKVTKGPWTSRSATVTKSDGFKIIVKGPAAAAPEAWESICERLYADAAFIARCNPTTMFAVCEALNAAKGTLRNSSSATVPMIARALYLLDGPTEKL